jgi:hypothetical protein
LTGEGLMLHQNIVWLSALSLTLRYLVRLTRSKMLLMPIKHGCHLIYLTLCCGCARIIHLTLSLLCLSTHVRGLCYRYIWLRAARHLLLLLLLLLSRICIHVTAYCLWQTDVRSLNINLLSPLPLATLVLLLMNNLALCVQEFLLRLRLDLIAPDRCLQEKWLIGLLWMLLRGILRVLNYELSRDLKNMVSMASGS